MDETKVAPAGSFCWNQECSDYGQVGKGNMRKNGKTPKGVQRYQCKTCKKTCGETKGTLFYRCRHSQETIVECLAMGGDRTSLAAIHRITGVKEETVGEWLERAAAHVHQFEEHLIRARKLNRVPLDAPLDLCRTQGRKRGQPEEEERGTFWRGTAIDMDTRLRVGRAIAKTEEEVAPQLMQQIKRHAPEAPPPAMSTDGKGAYREAMLRTWGKVPASRGRGKPPTLPKPDKDWHYLQVVKKRKGGRLVSVRMRVVYGDPEEVKAPLGAHTAYVERTHLTSRQMNGRLVRKTLSFSKELRLLEAASCWEDAMYNFTRTMKTLRLEQEEHAGSTRWRQRTPAMAAGLTDHVWTVQELLTSVLVPSSITT